MGRRNIGIKLNYTLSKASIGTFEKIRIDDTDIKKASQKMTCFLVAEKERFELSRRFHDLHP